MVEQQRPIDVPHRHAVVVDDDDALAFFVDLLAFQQAHLVGVHHDQQRVGVMTSSVGRADKIAPAAGVQKLLPSKHAI